MPDHLSEGVVVYAIVRDARGQTLAERYIVSERLNDWLLRACAQGKRCDVYSAAPASGGSRVRTLLREKRVWKEERVVAT